ATGSGARGDRARRGAAGFEFAKFRADWRAGPGGRRSDGVAGGDWAYAAGLSTHHVGGVVYRAALRQTFERIGVIEQVWVRETEKLKRALMWNVRTWSVSFRPRKAKKNLTLFCLRRSRRTLARHRK